MSELDALQLEEEEEGPSYLADLNKAPDFVDEPPVEEAEVRVTTLCIAHSLSIAPLDPGEGSCEDKLMSSSPLHASQTGPRVNVEFCTVIRWISQLLNIPSIHTFLNAVSSTTSAAATMENTITTA